MTQAKEYLFEDLKKFATEVVRDSGKQALSYYGKGESAVRFDAGLVTEAELRMTELFQTRLHDHFSEHHVFRNTPEEREYTHEGKRYLWIFDAIDGVANFQAGIPIWGSSIALLDNFWPVLGVFYMPVTGDLFHAQAGKKAYWGEREIRARSDGRINNESVLLTYSRFHQHYRSTFPGKIRNLGCTAAHICYVARGCSEAAVIRNETFHDLAAARVIIEAAGAKMYKMDGGEFFLNAYLDGQGIEEDLLVVAPENRSRILGHIHKED